MITAIEFAIIAFILWYIGSPLLKKEEASLGLLSEEEERKSELLHRKEAAFIGLQEAKIDVAAGKLSQEDFEELKRGYEADAVEVMKELDGVEATKKEEAPSLSAISAKSSLEKAQLNFCRECGSPLQQDSKFCSNCGTKV